VYLHNSDDKGEEDDGDNGATEGDEESSSTSVDAVTDVRQWAAKRKNCGYSSSPGQGKETALKRLPPERQHREEVHTGERWLQVVSKQRKKEVSGLVRQVE